MPSKRDLLGDPPPGDGPDLSDLRWKRIGAALVGVVTTGVYLSTASALDANQVPPWVGAVLAVGPVGFVWYGLSTLSWWEVLKASAGIAAGSVLCVSLL